MHLWIRMLFSCLTDADFLDTEFFMDKAKSGQRGGYPELATKLRAQFDEAMEKKAKEAGATAGQSASRQCAAAMPGKGH